MIYKIEFSKSAHKELRKLPKAVSYRLTKAIYRLSDNPRRGQVRPMVGSKSWRLRVGSYRVIYDVYDDKVVVLILKVSHRRQAYRN